MLKSRAVSEGEWVRVSFVLTTKVYATSCCARARNLLEMLGGRNLPITHQFEKANLITKAELKHRLLNEIC